MPKDIVITMLAKDRPGLVEQIAGIVTQYGGNWVESSMARLCGEFAGLLRVQVPEDRADALQDALEKLSGETMTITVCKAGQPVISQSGPRARLELTGLDHTGIVHQVTRVLARMSVNLEQLETKVFTASLSGEPMFTARAEIRLPEELDMTALREALETLAADIMVDINLDEEITA